MTDKKKIVLSIVAILVLVVGIIGVSYAAFTYSRTGEKVNTITTGTISMEYQESSNVISITNALPTTDATGKVRLNSGEYFDFTVITNISGNSNINWEIVAEDLDDSTFSGSNIKYYLTRLDGSNEVEMMAPRTYAEEVTSDEVTGRPVNMMSLLKGNTNTNGKISTNYRLRLYVDEKYNPQNDNGNLVYKTRINVYGKVGEDKSLASKLVKDYTNDSNITTYAAGDKSKMYTFQQQAREQQVGYTSKELTEYRYIGNVPNNYIIFNGETWRIIGVFTVEDKDGNKESRVKIMREESIKSYSWDNAKVENSDGKNSWSDAKLNYLLNPGHENENIGGSLYWNRGSGECYNGQNDATTACDFTNTGLTSDAKSKISDAKWYLGGYDYTGTRSVEVFHEKERGTNVFSSNSYPRETSWIGTVGLIYPSDYGYTYSLGVDSTCYGNIGFCYITQGGMPIAGWMYNGSISQWTLSPDSSFSNRVFYVNSSGYISPNSAYSKYGIRPVIYLKADVEFSSGSGTSADPFIIL